MNWKTIAIVFIILFVVETILFAGLMYIGTNELNKEKTCSNVCLVHDTDSFVYQDNVCSCYLNGNETYSEVFR